MIQAFEQAGRPVPPMPISGTTGGDLAWWYAHKATYQTVGVHFGGAQVGYTTLRMLFRILAGKGIKLNTISVPGVVATNANIGTIATPGKSVTWIGNIRGPIDSWLSNKKLDTFFTTPGSPKGF